MRIGMLTGGGDCPGAQRGHPGDRPPRDRRSRHAIIGFRDGWRGPLENAYEELTIESTRGILPRGGTILRSSRTNPFKYDDGPERVREHMDTLNLNGLIAIGARTRSARRRACTASTARPS